MELINRQDAIDEINKLTYPSSLEDVKRVLLNLSYIDTNKPIQEEWTNGKQCGYFYFGEGLTGILYKRPTEEVVPHRNYKYLSDFWCECGNHLGKKGDVKYCSDCGKKVKWDGCQ